MDRFSPGVGSMDHTSVAILAAIASAVGTGTHLSMRPCYDVFDATRSGFASCANPAAIALVDFSGFFVLAVAVLLGFRFVAGKQHSNL